VYSGATCYNTRKRDDCPMATRWMTAAMARPYPNFCGLRRFVLDLSRLWALLGGLLSALPTRC
jgi:hypothetical protein